MLRSACCPRSGGGKGLPWDAARFDVQKLHMAMHRHGQLVPPGDRHGAGLCGAQVAPTAQTTDPMGAPGGRSVQRGAHELVEAAVDPQNLSRLDPTWHPWF